jgi:hypothetical protein
MSQFNESGLKAFPAAGAITKFSRVTLNSSGQVATSAAAEDDIGIAETAAAAAGELVTVRLATQSGTCMAIASGVIAAGAKVYGAATGQIGTTNTNARVGIALEAAGAAGDLIEVLRRQVT